MKDVTLPCEANDECPYDYDNKPDRDVEGMPFSPYEDDPRECPAYGHVCPAFMEDFGLTVEELNIRALTHSAGLVLRAMEEGQMKERPPEVVELLAKLDEILKKYPPDQYPQYYEPTLEDKKKCE